MRIGGYRTVRARVPDSTVLSLTSVESRHLAHGLPDILHVVVVAAAAAADDDDDDDDDDGGGGGGGGGAAAADDADDDDASHVVACSLNTHTHIQL